LHRCPGEHDRLRRLAALARTLAVVPALALVLAATGCWQGSEGLAIVDESPVAGEPPPLSSETASLTARAAVLYLALDGVKVTHAGYSSSAKNQSSVCGATVPPFQSLRFGPQRAAVVSTLAALAQASFSGFALEVTTTRPTGGSSYEMIAVGGSPSLCGYASGVGGLAPLDCGDTVRGEVGFVFSDQITSLDFLATVIAHEAAHTFGLVHTTEACDTMSPLYCAGEKRFLDERMGVYPDQIGKCGSLLTNSHLALERALGLRAASEGPPAARDARATESGRAEAELGGPGLVEPGPQPGGSGCSAAALDGRGREPSSLSVALLVASIVLFRRIRAIARPTKGARAWDSSTSSPPPRGTRHRTRSWRASA
jgi:hypothetical protein